MGAERTRPYVGSNGTPIHACCSDASVALIFDNYIVRLDPADAAAFAAELAALAALAGSMKPRYEVRHRGPGCWEVWDTRNDRRMGIHIRLGVFRKQADAEAFARLKNEEQS